MVPGPGQTMAPVIFQPPFRIAQDFIRHIDFLHLPIGIRRGIDVGMIFAREASVHRIYDVRLCAWVHL